MIRPIIALTLALSLAACTTTGCAGHKAFRPDPGADKRFTNNEKRQVVAGNEFGEKQCGWKP